MAIPAEIDLTDVHMKPGRIRRRSFVPSEEADHFQSTYFFNKRISRLSDCLCRGSSPESRCWDRQVLGKGDSNLRRVRCWAFNENYIVCIDSSLAKYMMQAKQGAVLKI